MPAPHPPEFRRRAVEMARQSDKPISSIAKDLSISESCLLNWVTKADTDDGTTVSRLTSDDRGELAELRKDKRRLDIENEILTRAGAYFARENISPK